MGRVLFAFLVGFASPGPDCTPALPAFISDFLWA